MAENAKQMIDEMKCFMVWGADFSALTHIFACELVGFNYAILIRKKMRNNVDTIVGQKGKKKRNSEA